MSPHAPSLLTGANGAMVSNAINRLRFNPRLAGAVNFFTCVNSVTAPGGPP
jgi:hypothetical protein